MAPESGPYPYWPVNDVVLLIINCFIVEITALFLPTESYIGSHTQSILACDGSASFVTSRWTGAVGSRLPVVKWSKEDVELTRGRRRGQCKGQGQQRASVLLIIISGLVVVKSLSM